MYKSIDKIEFPKGKPLNIAELIDIISINDLLEKDRDIICFSYIPESGLTDSEEKLMQLLSEEGFKIDFVLTVDKEIFYVIRKISGNI